MFGKPKPSRKARTSRSATYSFCPAQAYFPGGDAAEVEMALEFSCGSLA